MQIVDRRTPPFVHLERYIFEDYAALVGPDALAAYLAIVYLAGGRSWATASHAQIGAAVGRDSDWAMDALCVLLRYGLIRRRDREGHEVEWSIIEDVPSPEEEHVA